MYVNSSLTAQRIQKFVLVLQRIQKFVLVLGSFWIRDSTHQREKFSLGILESLKFRWIPKDADLCLSLKFFR